MKDYKKTIGINPFALRGLVFACSQAFTAIYIDKSDVTFVLSGLFGYIYDNFYSSSDISYEDYINEMREMFSDLFNKDDMENL